MKKAAKKTDLIAYYPFRRDGIRFGISIGTSL